MNGMFGIPYTFCADSQTVVLGTGKFGVGTGIGVGRE